MTRRLAFLAMLAAVSIYGANFALSRLATLDGLTPHDLAALRFGVAGILMLPLFLRRGLKSAAGLGWPRALALATFSGLPMVLLMNMGLSMAPASHGAAIQPGTVTVIGAIGGIVLFKQLPQRISMIGILIVLVGLACIGLAATSLGSPTIILGDLCFLAAGALWGIYPLMLQRWQAGAIDSTAAIAVISMLAFLPIYALVLQPRLGSVEPGVVVFHAINQGIFNVIVGLWLWGTAVKIIGAAEAQRFPPLIPVIGTLFAIPILGEWPSLLQIVGVIMIVAGLGLTAFGPRLLRWIEASLTRP